MLSNPSALNFACMFSKQEASKLAKRETKSKDESESSRMDTSYSCMRSDNAIILLITDTYTHQHLHPSSTDPLMVLTGAILFVFTYEGCVRVIGYRSLATLECCLALLSVRVVRLLAAIRARTPGLSYMHHDACVGDLDCWFSPLLSWWSTFRTCSPRCILLAAILDKSAKEDYFY